MIKNGWQFPSLGLLGKAIAAIVLLLVTIFSLALISVVSKFSNPNTLSTPPYYSTDFAYDSKLFLSAIASLSQNEKQLSTKIIVIPHHLTAAPLIAQGVLSLKGETSPKSIFIISPNHSNIGNCDIITSDENWSTPFGTVQIDKEVSQIIIDSGAACLDRGAFANEHGVAGIIPFIKYFHPETKVVTIAIKKYINDEALKKLIAALGRYTGENYSFISSIDFSHNLSSKEASQKDIQTERLIVDQDYLQIQNLTDKNVDSPSSLIVSMKLAEQMGEKLQVINHKNSSDFNHSTTSVTSYFFLAAKSSSRDQTPTISVTSPVSRQGGTIKITPSSLTTPPTAVIRIHPISPNSPDTITLVFGGDVMLGRTVNTRMQKYKDHTWPFLKISDVLKNADLTMVNLESPFRTGCLPTDSGMVFCADPKSVSGLTYSGIDIVNLANNHILNQGKDGLTETRTILNAADIFTLGLKEPIFKTIKKTRFAFVGFNDIGGSGDQISTASVATIKAQILLAKKDADFIVTTFHFGNEYSLRSLRQQELARTAIDSGADMVIGHHPHWVQEYEEYKEKPIYYSLGNLVFDQMWSLETRKGLIVKFTIQNKKIIMRDEIPVLINDYGQPSLVNQPKISN